MNRKLNLAEMESVCRALMASEGRVTVRRLRAELKLRLGAVGRGERVLALWRRLGAAAEAPAEDVSGNSAASVRAWQARVSAAEQRAALAEEREQRHQDRWASEVYALRQRVEELTRQARTPNAVHQRYLDAMVEIHALKQRVAELGGDSSAGPRH
jgi:MoxR-like ATPase